MSSRKKTSSKSGRITLRMAPEVHEELVRLAPRFGMDLNGLINAMIHHVLPEMELQAAIYEWQRREAPNLVAIWREANPTRPLMDFLKDMKMVAAGEVVDWENGEQFRIAKQPSQDEMGRPTFIIRSFKTVKSDEEVKNKE